MRVTICVPTYNGVNKILNIVKALEKQTFQDFEIIIYLDGSTDSTKELLVSYTTSLKNLKILEAENGGRAKIRNKLAKEANGDLLIFFDDDMRPLPNCIEKHIQHHNEILNTILVGAQLEDYQYCKTDIQQYKAYLSRKWNLAIKTRLDYPYITAANFSIPKDLFLQYNGFDERLTDAEDYDLAIKLFEDNIPIYLDPEVIAWHDDFISVKSYIKRQREYTLAQARLKEINPLVGKYNQRDFIPKKGIKKRIMYLLSSSLFISIIDKEMIWIKLLPKKVRYKVYELVILSWAKYYPNKQL